MAGEMVSSNVWPLASALPAAHWMYGRVRGISRVIGLVIVVRVIRGRAVPFGVVVCAAVATAACGRRACVVRGMFMLLVGRDRRASCAAW